ncbi:MAG TPA: divalent metal cation transporter [Gammaproteobacteria bacterium]|nr:divalent metal cation transporter [Gammaproteobacteria bacterium]
MLHKWLRILGPGVVTGAADDDPSGIATYAQTGAQFGYNQLWTALFMLPLLLAIQEACARIGAVTGKGITAVVKQNYNKKLLYAVVGLVLFANTLNIGADIGAMAEAARLIVPINFFTLTIIFTAITLVLEIFITYRYYVKILKWLCLSLLAYPITVFIVKEPWWNLLRATFIPHIELNFQFLFIITGVLGTTITPYLFFWQASEEVEEERARHLISHGVPKISRHFIHNLRIDNFIGMFFSEVGTWAIIVVAATVLNAHGITDIKTAADAAKALEPLVHSFPHSGYWAKVIFAVGIIGLGLLAVPVLAGSAAYALSEALNWREGLNLKFKKAHGFYGVITIATLLGLSINFVGIDPMKALVFVAVINGIAAVPLIFIIALIARNEVIMGQHKSGLLSNFFVWVTFFGMAITVGAMFYTFINASFH